MKLLSLFSGIGAFEKALNNLEIPYDLVGFSEIDKYAIKSYCVIHNVDSNLNLGDVSKIDETNLKNFDFMTWGFPCQDISVAGKGKGIIEGETRSGLLYEALRILKYKKPKYSICENVKNLVGKRFKKEFANLLDELDEMGYNNYWKILNAKNFGVPQNRERVFIVSIRKDVDNGNFEFPMGFDNGIRLKDILEHEVDEKYYINSEKTEKLLAQLDYEKAEKLGIDMSINDPKFKDCANCISTKQRGISNRKSEGTGVCIPCLTPERINKKQNGGRFKEDGDPMYTLTSQDRHEILKAEPIRLGGIFDTEKSKHQAGSVWDQKGVSPTLDTMQGGYRQPSVIVKEATKKGYAIAQEGDSINIQFPNSKTRRGRVGKQIAQTLETSCNQATLTNGYRIRKLTPTECFLLMGFEKSDIDKCIEIGISNTQLYKQAGNSIVVTVAEALINNLINLTIAYSRKEL